MRLWVLAAAVALTMCGGSQAAYVDVGHAKVLCTNDTDCSLFVAGAFDAFDVAQTALSEADKTPLMVCPPATTTVGDMVRVFKAALTSGKVDDSATAADALFTAVQSEWPC